MRLTAGMTAPALRQRSNLDQRVLLRDCSRDIGRVPWGKTPGNLLSVRSFRRIFFCALARCANAPEAIVQASYVPDDFCLPGGWNRGDSKILVAVLSEGRIALQGPAGAHPREAFKFERQRRQIGKRPDEANQYRWRRPPDSSGPPSAGPFQRLAAMGRLPPRAPCE